MSLPFEITKEEVLNVAAQKLFDAFMDEGELHATAMGIVEKRIENVIGANLSAKVDAFLSEEMTRILGQEVVPVDIWGEKAGEPTTIRSEIAKKAREFWDVKVDEEGNEGRGWNGEPRHKWLYKQIAKEEFTKAVKDNSTEIAAAFKAALKADAVAITSKHIDELIRTK